jgi:hypothetical protein
VDALAREAELGGAVREELRGNDDGRDLFPGGVVVPG